MDPAVSFRERLLIALIQDAFAFQNGNRDYDRLRSKSGRWAEMKRKAKDFFLEFVSAYGFVRCRSLDPPPESLLFILRHLDGLEEIYSSLEDQYSKSILLEVLRYRVWDADRVRLSRNNDAYSKAVLQARAMEITARNTFEVASHELSLYRIRAGERDLQIHAHPMNILNIFLLNQYEYRHGNVSIGAEAGDIVIDAGGCWGDSALYFAEKIGPGGRVYCFEFVGENVEVLRANLRANGWLAERIAVVEKALSNESGKSLLYRSGGGPGTSLAKEGVGDREVQTESIDDFVEREGLERVSLIKMDIEGAELSALQGAQRTIRFHRPKLAISVYHRQADLLSIPQFLREVGGPYQLFLDHFSISGLETVLFAAPRPVAH